MEEKLEFSIHYKFINFEEALMVSKLVNDIVSKNTQKIYTNRSSSIKSHVINSLNSIYHVLSDKYQNITKLYHKYRCAGGYGSYKTFRRHITILLFKQEVAIKMDNNKGRTTYVKRI
jgi:hypothetical protein